MLDVVAYSGRSFSSSTVSVPGLLVTIDGENSSSLKTFASYGKMLHFCKQYLNLSEQTATNQRQFLVYYK